MKRETMQANKFNVLLVEDNQPDINSTRLAFDHDTRVDMNVVKDGKAALDYLRSHPNGNTPHLIILDINIPYYTGIEVLKTIRQSQDIKIAHIPIVIITSSNGHIEESYQAGANGYVVKPFRPKDYQASLMKVKEYWVSVNRPPGLSTRWRAG